MASNNPDITASDIVTDVEARLQSPSISGSVYLPWISYSYNRTYAALFKCNQRVKEELFGDSDTITLSTTSPNEYTLTDEIPRFGGIIKVEVKFGATGDNYVKAKRLPSIAIWNNQEHVSTEYRAKENVLYYLLQDKIGFIPTPPESGAIAKIWYIKRPYQITALTDVIDIPYRFMYPVVNYVQSKAIERENQDYTVGQQIENRFIRELEEVATMADSEQGEYEGANYVVSTDTMMTNNPFDY